MQLRIGPVTTHGGKDWTSFKLDSFSIGDGWEWPNDGKPRTVAVREYVLGAITGDGQMLGYPPIHPHHYHLEDSTDDPINKFGFPGRMITHGDDSCVTPTGAWAGGVDCTIRRVSPGHAMQMQLPFYLSADFNDVRANNSEGLSWSAAPPHNMPRPTRPAPISPPQSPDSCVSTVGGQIMRHSVRWHRTFLCAFMGYSPKHRALTHAPAASRYLFAAIKGMPHGVCMRHARPPPAQLPTTPRQPRAHSTATLHTLPIRLPAAADAPFPLPSLCLPMYLPSVVPPSADGTLKPYTQIKLVFNPYSHSHLPGGYNQTSAYFNTYLVPAHTRTAYWQEGACPGAARARGSMRGQRARAAGRAGQGGRADEHAL